MSSLMFLLLLSDEFAAGGEAQVLHHSHLLLDKLKHNILNFLRIFSKKFRVFPQANEKSFYYVLRFRVFFSKRATQWFLI